MSRTPAEPFTRASIYLGPILEAYEFRAVSREYHDDTAEGSASAEYRLGDLAIRLIWESSARALWLESARASGGAMISRWIDIEWIAAGEEMELDTSLDDDRLERLASALRRFLEEDGGEAG